MIKLTLEEMSKKAVRELLRRLGREYEIDENFLKKIEKNYIFLRGRKKIFITTYSAPKFDPQREGIHIISEEKFGLRLSVEGSQIFGPYAKRKVVELNEKGFWRYLQGFDIEKELPYKREFVIVKYKSHFLGSALAYPNKLVNYLPKARRIVIEEKKVKDTSEE